MEQIITEQGLSIQAVVIFYSLVFLALLIQVKIR